MMKQITKSKPEIVYGINPIIELLRAGRRACHEIFLSRVKGEHVGELIKLAGDMRIRIKDVEKGEVDRLSGVQKNQGVAAKVDPYHYITVEELGEFSAKADSCGFIAVFDGITDPQNLGSLIRTAHLMGVHGIILPRDNSASVNATVAKVSSGATEHTHISLVTNLVNSLDYFKDMGFWVSGAEGEAECLVYDHDFTQENVIFVLGSEGKGMRRLVRERCDYLLKLPMYGSIDSYNVSIAGALFMGEVMRQRQLNQGKNRTEIA